MSADSVSLKVPSGIVFKHCSHSYDTYKRKPEGDEVLAVMDYLAAVQKLCKFTWCHGSLEGGKSILQLELQY